ncbi:MAG: cation:proton antiporter [Bacteroidota bacterium]
MNEIWEKLQVQFTPPFGNSVLIFSVVLLIILLSPLLLRPLKIPGIIGLIISGMVVGPYGFNLIEKNAGVDLFSTIGLLYIMFLAGLDLNMRVFAKNRFKSFVFGFLTFSIPLTIGFPVCVYLLGYGFEASLLTASMFATHTLVAYPIVSKLGISKNEAVAVTVGGTIFTDTTVLIMFAVIVGSASGNLDQEFLIRLGISVAIFLSFVVFIVPNLARWFFRKLEGEKYSHYIFVLAIVFFCAFFAEMAGLEPIIGAFAAGLALNRLIPQTSSLMNRIDFVGNSLFIPFFLFSVGMIINLNVVMNGPQTLIVAGVLTAFAILGKWLAAWLTAIIMRFSKDQRNLVFGLSSSHAAATLAIILVGYKMQIIDEYILNGTIILILVTCLVASFVTENAGKKVALQEEHEHPHDKTNKSEEKILLPITEPSSMGKLLDFAIMIKRHRSLYPIFSLSVVDDEGDEVHQKLYDAKAMLNKAIVYAAAYDERVEIITTIDQNFASGLKRVSRELLATDVIIGNPKKTEALDILFGNHMQQVLNATVQTVYICNFTKALNVHGGIRVLCPPYSEKEFGFKAWLHKIDRLARNLNQTLHLYSTQETFDEIIAYQKSIRSQVKAKHTFFNDWEDFIILSREFEKDDLILVVSPRKGSISYTQVLERVPTKLVKHFGEYSFVVVVPETQKLSNLVGGTNDVDSTFIEKGIAQIRKGGSGIRKIFKKDKDFCYD